MLSDAKLKEAVQKYDGANSEYKAILYACIRGGAKDVAKATAIAMVLRSAAGFAFAGATAALSNDFVIMTVNSDCLTFYVLNKWSFGADIESSFAIPYAAIDRIKISRSLIWWKFGIRYEENQKRCKLNVLIYIHTLGIKRQKENMQATVEYLETI